MTIAIVHSTVGTTPDEAGVEINKTEWNDDHVVSGTLDGAIPFISSGALADSASLKWGTTAGQGLTLNAGTAATDVSALDLSQTWGNAAVAFKAFKLTITDTNSAPGALAVQILGGAAGTTNLLSLSKAGALSLQYGSVSVPAITWDASSNTGIWGESNQVNITLGGVDQASFSSSYLWLKRQNYLITFGSSGDVGLSRLSSGVFAVGTGTTGSFAGSLKLTNTQNVGYQELDEMTAPSGATNAARIFTQDNGAGKTQLMVIFGSGAAQQLAIEA